MQNFQQESSGSWLPSTLTQSASFCRGLGCVDPRMFTTDNLKLEDSYVGAAVALIACRISQSFRLHVTLGGISMSQATLVHLCCPAALKCKTAPQHHVRLCGWQPTPLMQHPFCGDLSFFARETAVCALCTGQ